MHKDSLLPRRWANIAERSELVSLYRSSGLTQAEFAKQHGINVHTLRQWVYRRGTAGRTAKAVVPGMALREVSLSTLLPTAWAAEVVLPSGVSVRLNSAASPELIAQLLDQLSPKC